jgi:N-acetyl-anhydromuramyl-L-alanine amidase AmpD
MAAGAQPHLIIADIKPPMGFGDLDINMRSGVLTGSGVRQGKCTSYGRRLFDPTVIMIHFTAGPGNADRSIKAMNDRGVSAHLIVGRSGGLWQCVPFTRIAFHAGFGAWGGYRNNMNDHSIGIETCNLGPLWRTRQKQLVDSYGIERTDRATEPKAHKNARSLDLKKLFGEEAYNRIVAKGVEKPDLANCEWEVFPDEQLDALQRVCSLLVTRYPSIRHIIGHDDYAPDRKIDPGPALDMERWLTWMPAARTIIYQDDHRRPSYVGSLDSPDYMRNRVTTRTFAAGNVGRDIA